MTNALAPRRLGAKGPAVFPLALGCLGMSGTYGPTSDDESVAASTLPPTVFVVPSAIGTSTFVHSWWTHEENL